MVRRMREVPRVVVENKDPCYEYGVVKKAPRKWDPSKSRFARLLREEDLKLLEQIVEYENGETG